MARAGYGGLLPCVKTTDAADYLTILRQAGRERDVIHVTLDNDIPFRLNFLEYEQRRSGKGIDQVLVHLVSNIQEVIERGKHSSGGDPFWRQSTNKLIQYGLTVLRAAGLSLSLPSIFKMAVEAPTSAEERDDPGWRQPSAFLPVRRPQGRRRGPQESGRCQRPGDRRILFFAGALPHEGPHAWQRAGNF